MTLPALASRIEHVPTDAVRPRPGNPRTHSAKQIQQIADSIAAFGFNNPILIDGQRQIVAGHGRWAAAHLLKLPSVPTVQLHHMTPEQVRAYVIADNKLVENSGWDKELLKFEISAILEADPEFSLDMLGFETPELDILFGEQKKTLQEVAVDPVGAAVSHLEDLWLIGDHRLYCGSALAGASYTALLAGCAAKAIFTDPPYNVPIKGHVGGNGKIQHREFVMASGEMSPDEFQAFLKTSCGLMANALTPGGIAFLCMDWRGALALQLAAHPAFSELKNICVWDKGSGGMGSLYRSQHELVFVYKAGKQPHTNNVELGRHGRNRTNVWSYAGVLARRGELALHPTVKPVTMIADAIRDVTKRGDIVLDPFAGSGSTLLAAHRTKRRGYAIELDPLYVDVAIRRLEAETGLTASLAATGETFAERAARAAAGDGLESSA